MAANKEDACVVLENGNWELVGDLLLPDSEKLVPAVLLLNQAAGDRKPYKYMAEKLVERQIASLRLDLRGHGESTNYGEFVPGEGADLSLIIEAYEDIIFAHEYLMSNEAIAGNKIGFVGASYSGEAMAEAGRVGKPGQAYVALSPGSFSEQSINGIDSSGIPWLYVTSKNDQFLLEVNTAVEEISQQVEMVILPGEKHGTDILEARPGLAGYIAVWLERAFG
ncbi:MAG: hypothetical protein FVQ83_16320 [Chloroflexi bacterium]|nr:hypothetical protein [Chloroflexota bacterium]